MEDMEIDEELTPSFTVSTLHAMDNLRTEDLPIPSVSQAKDSTIIEAQPSAIKNVEFNSKIEDKASSMSQTEYYMGAELCPAPAISQVKDNTVIKVKPVAITPQAQVYAIIEDEPTSASAVYTPTIEPMEVHPVPAMSQAIKNRILKVKPIAFIPQAKVNAVIEDEPTSASSVCTSTIEPMEVHAASSISQDLKNRVLKLKPVTVIPQAKVNAVIEDEPTSASGVCTPTVQPMNVHPVSSMSQAIKNRILKVKPIAFIPQAKVNAVIEDEPTSASGVCTDSTDVCTIEPMNVHPASSISQDLKNRVLKLKPVTFIPQAKVNAVIEDEPTSASAVSSATIEPTEVCPASSMSQNIKNRVLKLKPVAFRPQAKVNAVIEDEPTSAAAVSSPTIEPTALRPVFSMSENIKNRVLKVKPVTFKPQAKAYEVIEDEPTSTSAVYNWMREQLGHSKFQSQKVRENPVDGWSKDEKFLLYIGLKSKHAKRVEAIQESIPNKTKKEIEAAIAYYRERASNHPECTLRKLKVRKVKAKPHIPLATWAKVLTDHLSFHELQTESANAFRLIADLEDIPSPACTEMIDFQMVYHQIADAMEGKALSNDRFVSEVLNSCLLDAALVGKSFIKPSSFKQVINSINFKEKEVPLFPRPTKDNELAIIRHFCALRNYNPLGIVEENLTPIVNIQKVNDTEEHTETNKEM